MERNFKRLIVSHRPIHDVTAHLFIHRAGNDDNVDAFLRENTDNFMDIGRDHPMHNMMDKFNTTKLEPFTVQ